MGIIHLEVEAVVRIQEAIYLLHRSFIAKHGIDAISRVPNLLITPLDCRDALFQHIHTVMSDEFDMGPFGLDQLHGTLNSCMHLVIHDDGISFTHNDRHSSNMAQGRCGRDHYMAVEDDPEDILQLLIKPA